MSDERTGQNHPIQAGSEDSTRDEQLQGLVEQVKADVALGNAHDERALLRQRLDDAGIPADDAEIDRLLG